jgi:hypothetical protein
LLKSSVNAPPFEVGVDRPDEQAMIHNIRGEGFVDIYRTMCFAPEPAFRRVFALILRIIRVDADEKITELLGLRAKILVGHLNLRAKVRGGVPGPAGIV